MLLFLVSLVSCILHGVRFASVQTVPRPSLNGYWVISLLAGTEATTAVDTGQVIPAAGDPAADASGNAAVTTATDGSGDSGCSRSDFSRQCFQMGRHVGRTVRVV